MDGHITAKNNSWMDILMAGFLVVRIYYCRTGRKFTPTAFASSLHGWNSHHTREYQNIDTVWQRLNCTWIIGSSYCLFELIITCKLGVSGIFYTRKAGWMDQPTFHYSPACEHDFPNYSNFSAFWRILQIFFGFLENIAYIFRLSGEKSEYFT